MSYSKPKRSKLELYVSKRLFFAFTFADVKENVRPQFIFNYSGRWLELDFYIPELKIAIEVQGKQHYEHIPFFHPTEEDFKARQESDALKRLACAKEGVYLYEVFDEQSADSAIQQITKKYLESHMPSNNTDLTGIRARMIVPMLDSRGRCKMLAWIRIKKKIGFVKEWDKDKIAGEMNRRQCFDFKVTPEMVKRAQEIIRDTSPDPNLVRIF